MKDLLIVILFIGLLIGFLSFLPSERIVGILVLVFIIIFIINGIIRVEP
jgi:hypothetical protein